MFITHDGAQLFTVSFGTAPRTLVAHGGWTGSWELWTLPFGPLSASWRTVAYDHRGTGTTVAPAGSISLDALVADLFAVLDAFNIERCVLAAESAGAVVALTAALQAPQRFSGLVLVDGLYYQPAPAGEHPFVTALKANYPAAIAQFVDNCVTPSTGEAVRRWGRQILERAPQDSAIRLFEVMLGIDLRAQLSQIQLPVLVIHGEHDRLLPLDAARWLVGQLPNARLHVVSGAGHVPTVTHPDEVAAAIDSFFAASVPPG